MASFPKMQLTAKGIALLTKVQDGTQLKYTKVKIGSGKLNGEPISPLTDLIAVNVVMTELTGEKVGNNTFKIGSYFDNKTITKGFTWREIGIFALDPQEGEVLYAYSNAGDAGDYIPVATDKRIEKYLYTYVSISNAENVTVETQGSEIFVTKPVFDTALINKVDKEKGKGLSTNDYTTAEKEKLATLQNYDDSGLRQEISTKADLTYLNTKLTEQQTKVDFTRTYTLSHNRAEATIIKGLTSDVGVGEKSPDNPYVLSGVETNGVTLYSLPNGISDEYNTQTGVLTKRVGKVVLNGSEVWHKWDIDKQIFTVDINKKGIRGKEISDKFTRWEGTGWTDFSNLGFYVSEAGSSINFRNNQYVTIDEFKHFLSKNPVTALYELETPETIQLTPKTTYQHTLTDLPTLEKSFVEIGSFLETDGSENPYSGRIRSSFISINSTVTFDTANYSRFDYYYYDSSKKYIGRTNNGTARFIRILFKRIDNGTISSQDLIDLNLVVNGVTALPKSQIQNIYQCQFIAQADYTEGDVFTDYTAKPTGEETILPDKAFVKGDIVSVLVDTVNKKLGFKLGGSGFNQTLPPQVRSFAVTSGNGKNTLSWRLPVDTTAYEGLTIVRKIGSAPTKISDGTKISLSKTATSYTDTNVVNDTKYYYRAFPYNSKKQYQTELTGAVVSGTPKAFSLPTYTGQHAIFGNEIEGRIEMYTSGTLTLSPATYDIFAVGGGGGGASGYGGGGGGGGYTNTVKNENMRGDFNVEVGSGGNGGGDGGSAGINGSNGGATQIFNSPDNKLITTVGGFGGKTWYERYNAGDGGSGGGRGAYSKADKGGDGGTDGGDGGSGGVSGGKGKGQHTTTRAFGEITGTLYAGGGGGSGYKDYVPTNGGSGGAGGGGNGGDGGGENHTKGDTNTGGGSGASGTASLGAYAGGSGIAIIRWKRN